MKMKRVEKSFLIGKFLQLSSSIEAIKCRKREKKGFLFISSSLNDEELLKRKGVIRLKNIENFILKITMIKFY